MIKIPDDPQTGKPVKLFARDVVKWMRANTITNVIGGKVRKSTNGFTIEIDKAKQSDFSSLAEDAIKPPFYVDFRQVDGTPDTYFVTVNPGYVYEVVPYGNEALNYFEPENILTEISISPDEAVYVKVKLLADGTIGSDNPDPAVEIIVQSNNSASVYYEPKVDDETSTGSVGTMYYKLAVLESGSPPSINRILSGSHICHHQDLPKIATTIDLSAGIGVIPKDFDSTTGEYRLRALTEGLGQLTIETNADDIEIRGNKKLANLLIQRGDASPDITPIMEFEDGLTKTGAESVGNEDPAVDPQEVVIKMPTVVAGTGITVTNTAAPDDFVYEVSTDGDLGETVYHPWKITRTAANTWLVKGGFVFGFNGESSIDVPDTTVSTSDGVIYLFIERDTTTRQIISAEIQTDLAVAFPDEEGFQYIDIGRVEEAGTPQIIQRRFDDVRVFEMLIVSNGELKLGNFAMQGQNNYDLP